MWRIVSAIACWGALGLFLFSLTPPAREKINVIERASNSSQWMTKEELNRRMYRAIREHFNHKVVYEGILGEGQGAWDFAPRYPTDRVNCIIWLTLVLAEAYSNTAAEKIGILDRLRYFDDVVSFGTRKHFVDHWLKIDPAPLLEMGLDKYTRLLGRKKVKLDYGHFLKSHRYTCHLYKQEVDEFEIEYADPKGILEVAQKLPEGYYLFFGVATTKYLERYGKESGPMGLVHGMILELFGEPGGRSNEQMFVYHASTSAGKVMHENLDKYVTRMTENLHAGYVLYDLNPEWDHSTPLQPSPEALEIQRCELNSLQVK
ncbi:DUF1460 domain-containing protein [bacterium]|jgi:hypothetical protein|nr:DUF1460 domain-containing protein [bacterium]